MFREKLTYFSILIILMLESINCVSIKKFIHKKSLNETIAKILKDESSKLEGIFAQRFNINKETFEQINKLISPGDTIVELGSGAGTEALTLLYNVYSIEHDPKWVNKVNKSHYIYAPLKNYTISEFEHHKSWYDIDIIKANLPKKYHLILVDGPTGKIGRGGFYQFINIFDTTVPILFDDIGRSDELKLANLVSKYLNRPLNVIKTSVKSFGVIDKSL